MTTPLVLLPGMMCDARLFAPQITTLGHFRAVHVAPVTNHDTITALASEILQNAPPVFALAGLSMGGIVAMEVLRLAPHRVERIALLDTNPLMETDKARNRRVPQMKAARDGKLATIMQDEMKPHYLSDGPRKNQILALCMEMALDLGPHVFVNQSRALMDRRDQTETLSRARVPALVLCGRDDRLCPLSRHELMAGLINGSVLEVIEGAGHLPVLEQPDATCEALSRWLAA